jgi:threonine dehydrogenase-like Zn-dependent dehydrogenase
VRRWSDDLLDLLSGSDDVLGLEGLATHHAPLEDAPELYRTFQEKRDDCLKVVLRP